MSHICHISTTFNLRSGSARRTSAILKGCLEQGHIVTLVVGRDHDVQPVDLPEVDIRVVPELVKYVSPRHDVIVPWRVKEILQQIKPDLVHTHLAKAGIVGRVAARYAGVPWVVHTVHGPTFPRHLSLFKRRLFCTLEKISGRFTDQFVFVGREIREEYINAGVCSADSSCVIQTGRPDSVFDRLTMSKIDRMKLRQQLCKGTKPEFFLVNVGRLVPAKQIDHAIRIIKGLHQRKVMAHLAVIGKCLLKEEQQYETMLRKLACEIGVHEYVHFTGFRNDIIEVMEASDGVLLTSQYEGLPNVAVEAVIARVPMITYEVAGVREIIQKRNGCIIPQGDMDKAVEKLIQLLHPKVDESEPDALRPKSVLQDFRESVMVARKMQFYKHLLSKRQ